MSRDPIEVDEATGEAKSGNAIRKLYGEGRIEELDEAGRKRFADRLAHLEQAEPTESQRAAFDADVARVAAACVPLEPSSQMQHVAGSVLRRGRAHANEYGAELVVISIEREPKPEAALEGLPAPGYAFGMASTSDDDETIALALRAIASRLERA
jgi:hypothetical protein